METEYCCTVHNYAENSIYFLAGGGTMRGEGGKTVVGIGGDENTNLVVRRRGRHLSGVKDVVTKL